MELEIRYWCCTIFWPIVVNSAPSPTCHMMLCFA
jgi:hypothetical protein